VIPLARAWRRITLTQPGLQKADEDAANGMNGFMPVKPSPSGAIRLPALGKVLNR
jgi:hypothetical protein